MADTNRYRRHLFSFKNYPYLIIRGAQSTLRFYVSGFLFIHCESGTITKNRSTGRVDITNYNVGDDIYIYGNIKSFSQSLMNISYINFTHCYKTFSQYSANPAKYLRTFTCTDTDGVMEITKGLTLGGFAFQNSSFNKCILYKQDKLVKIDTYIFASTYSNKVIFKGTSCEEYLNNYFFNFSNGYYGLPYYSTNGVYLDNDETPITQIVYPNGITKLGSGMFAKCKYITEIPDFPQTLTSIGAACFAYTGITEIPDFPQSLTLGNEVFAGCASETFFNITNSKNLSITSNTFTKCYMKGIRFESNYAVPYLLGCLYLKCLILNKNVSTEYDWLYRTNVDYLDICSHSTSTFNNCGMMYRKPTYIILHADSPTFNYNWNNGFTKPNYLYVLRGHESTYGSELYSQSIRLFDEVNSFNDLPVTPSEDTWWYTMDNNHLLHYTNSEFVDITETYM